MPLYDATVPQMRKMLANLDGWLEKAEAFAKERGFEADRFVDFRLAPDQFALARQVQASCDTAKFTAARLTGKEAPKDADDETTVAALRARIQKTRAYLETITAKDFEGADTRVVKLPFLEGKGALGGEYLNAFALPNFLFHVTTSYAILRHNGVPLGKRDFIGGMEIMDL